MFLGSGQVSLFGEGSRTLIALAFGSSSRRCLWLGGAGSRTIRLRVEGAWFEPWLCPLSGEGPHGLVKERGPLWLIGAGEQDSSRDTEGVHFFILKPQFAHFQGAARLTLFRKVNSHIGPLTVC